MEETVDDKMDKKEADGVQTETIYLVPDTEYTFVMWYATVMGAIRTKGISVAVWVTEWPRYQCLVAAQTGTAV